MRDLDGKQRFLQVIGFTILDVNRSTRANERPMTPEQARELRALAKRIQSNSGESLSCSSCTCACTLVEWLYWIFNGTLQVTRCWRLLPLGLRTE